MRRFFNTRSTQNKLVSIVVIVTFVAITLVTDKLTWTAARLVYGDVELAGRVWVLGAVHWIIPHVIVPFIVTGCLFGRARIFDLLGLNRSAIIGLGFALLCTLPLLLAFALTSPLAPAQKILPNVLHYAVFAGLSEEVLFRCFLFGLLFRTAGWGFLQAALLGAVIFGLVHLSQGRNMADIAGVFAITFVAGLWWAWLYVEWSYNAWVPIGFHIFMNMGVNVFDVTDIARLPLNGEIVRLLVVIGSILLTIYIARKRGGLILKGGDWLRGLDGNQPV